MRSQPQSRKKKKMLKQSKISNVLKGLRVMRRSGDESTGGCGTVAERRVPEGHFVVVAAKGEEMERFIVRLDCLSDPAFLRLLEKAGDEYGFGQKGPLAVPCNAGELQNIVDNHMRCT